MSYLVDQTDQYFTELSDNNSLSDQPTQCEEELKKGEFLKLNNKIGEQINRQGVNHYFINQNKKYCSYCMHHPNINNLSSFLQIIECDKTERNWKNQLKLMDERHNFIKINTKDRIILLYKDFIKKTSQTCLSPIKISIDPKNGSIKIIISQYSGFVCTSLESLRLLKLFLIETKIIIQRFKDLFINIYQLACHHKLVDSSDKMVKQKPGESLSNKIHSYLKKFGVYLSFISSNQVDNITTQQQNKEKQSKQRIMHNLQILTHQQNKLLSLFTIAQDVYAHKLTINDLQFQFLDRQDIKNRVKMPGLSKCRSILQNNSILNYIRINNLDRLQIKPFNQGGFSTIHIAQIQYWYVYSGSNNQAVVHSPQQKFSKANIISKMMVIKKQVNTQGYYRNRVQHQKQILKKIKNGNALFIPKYYIPTDDCPLRDDLLIDFVMQPNLMEYTAANRLSLSLYSKIYILFMLIQAARYLKLYNIVHLDLKPNNVMVSKTLMTKLIDFGQSYHPQICKQNFKPGFTMPYSSPQSYSHSNVYTQKNDIFSIGVIGYELLYGKFPFFFHNQAHKHEVYLNNQIDQHWFYNPQELQNYGDSKIFPLIQLMLGRCLDPDPERRPELDWLCLILRECIQYYD